MFVRQRYFKYLFYWIIYRYFYIVDLHSISILTQFLRSISSIHLIIHSFIFYIVFIYIYFYYGDPSLYGVYDFFTDYPLAVIFIINNYFSLVLFSFALYMPRIAINKNKNK